MIECLTFEAAPAAGGRSVRRARFVKRSTLPLSAVCLVANGVREALSRALAVDLDVAVREPVVPEPPERDVLLAEAIVVRARGRICDGFVIVRPADARKLAALAFGETDGCDGVALSAIERVTLDRLLLGIVPLCNSLCGPLGAVVREAPERAAADLATYFEVRATGRTPFAVGFGLTLDPLPEVAECIELDALGEVELRGRVEVGAARVSAEDFATLAPQSTIALDASLEGSGILRLGGVAFARGTCGVANGRVALRIETGARA